MTKESPPFSESQQFLRLGSGDTELRSVRARWSTNAVARLAQAGRDLFEGTQPSGDWLRSAARLIIQVGIIVAGLAILNHGLLFRLVEWFGDTLVVRTATLTLVVVLYAVIYQATSVRHKRIPAAWSSVMLLLVELSVLGAMSPFLILLVQSLFPEAFLNRVFLSDNWAAAATFILMVFIGTRGWSRYMHRAAQATQAKATAEIYERLAFEDSLTGLANRRKFEACISEWLTSEALTCQSVSLLLIDVDRFKSINDGFSHNVGDEVLRQIAQTLKSNLAPGALPARLAGDEFVVVLRGCSDAEADGTCRRLAQAVADFDWSKVADGLKVSISVGCASARPGELLAGLLRRSDEHMYRVKREGQQ